MVDQRVHVPAPAVDVERTAVGQTAVERTVLGAGGPGAAEVPPSVPPVNEGKTTAAWTTVAIVLVGAVVTAVGVAIGLPALAWSGAGVIVAGPVVGGVMRSLGYGQRRRDVGR